MNQITQQNLPVDFWKLYTDEEFKNTTYTEKLKVRCYQCHNEFYKSKKSILQYQTDIKNNKRSFDSFYCSAKCANNNPAKRQNSSKRKLGVKNPFGEKGHPAKGKKRSITSTAVSLDCQELCHFGCGNKAQYKLGSGNLCCCQHCNSCPAIRLKNSLGGKKAVQEGRRTYKNHYESLPQETKDRMAWSRGKTTENDERVKKYVETRKKHFAEGKFKIFASGVALDDSLRWKRKEYPTLDSFGNQVNLESINEVKFAELCNELDVKWVKAKRFKLSNGRSYAPDFHLVDFNIYTDPKSIFWMKNFNHNQQEKINLFEKEYNTKLVIFWDTELSNWKNQLLELIKKD